MEVWNCKCCFKSHFSSIGQINERTSRPMCTDVSLFIGALRGTKVHRWICHHAWADSPLNCPEPVSDNSPVNCRTITEIGCHHIWIQIHRWIVRPSQSPHLGRFTAELSWACVRQFTGESLKLVVTTYETAELSDHHNHHAWADSPLNCPEPVSNNSPVNFCLMTSHAPIGWQIRPKRIAEAKHLHCNGFWRERGQCSGGTKMNFENSAYRRR